MSFMSDILFVAPVNKQVITEECIGTLILASLLRSKGVDVDIYRFFEADKSKGFFAFVDETADNILAKNPKVVSFYCRCDCFLTNIRIAERLKELRPSLPIVFGGPQADACCRETLEEIEAVDYCCSGEGETTVYSLFSALLEGGDVTEIEGLTYRDEKGNVVVNPRPALIKNLDKVADIDYSFVPVESMRQVTDGVASLAIDVGRGCPFNCAYCSTSLFWNRKFRTKSPDRIVEEMKNLNQKYGVKKFVFEHDLFTANKKNVLEFCDRLKESGIDAGWSCSSRVDTIDEEMIDAMVKVGFGAVYFGIETGSPRMQKIIHKNLKNSDVLRICRYLKEKNVEVIASFMYGFPEETEEDLNDTMKLVRELVRMGVTTFQFHLCAIFPSTEYFDKYRKELVFASHHSDQVSDFGLYENYDFICEHKSLFPFYYEYHNDHRKRFAGFEKVALSVIRLYDICQKFDKDRFENMSLAKMSYDFLSANEELVKTLRGDKDCKEHFREMSKSYLATVYDGDNLTVMSQIIDFICDRGDVAAKSSGAMDVKCYSIDINDCLKGESLSDIKLKTTMVYYKVNDGKVGSVIKYI